VPREHYRLRDRIKAYILDIKKTTKDPQIVLSRTYTGFIKELFKTEVPEINEGIVTIKGIAREPGTRTKIAVDSSNPDVDPVGACVGTKGARVQNIVQELRGKRLTSFPGLKTRQSLSAMPWHRQKSWRSFYTMIKRPWKL